MAMAMAIFFPMLHCGKWWPLLEIWWTKREHWGWLFNNGAMKCLCKRDPLVSHSAYISNQFATSFRSNSLGLSHVIFLLYSRCILPLMACSQKVSKAKKKKINWWGAHICRLAINACLFQTKALPPWFKS